jgi:hypothetical protein
MKSPGSTIAPKGLGAMMWRLLSIGLALALGLVGSRAVGDTAEAFVLQVNGSPAMAFSVDCQLEPSAQQGPTRFRDKDLTPLSYRLHAPALACIVRKRDAAGRLSVRLLAQDETLIAKASTAGPFNWVVLRSDGPWGKADARIGATPLIVRNNAIPRKEKL